MTRDEISAMLLPICPDLIKHCARNAPDREEGIAIVQQNLIDYVAARQPKDERWVYIEASNFFNDAVDGDEDSRDQDTAELWYRAHPEELPTPEEKAASEAEAVEWLRRHWGSPPTP